MDYTIKEVAEMSGVSSRTLRFYHEEELLRPKKMSEAGYRIYGEEELARLQQILLYKELGLKLVEIKQILDEPNFDFEQALLAHKQALEVKKAAFEQMIKTVELTLLAYQGGEKMTGEEQFIGLKKALVAKNEKEYGGESREKYGDEAVDLVNQKLLDLTQEEMKELEKTQNLLFERLTDALQQTVVTEELQATIFDLHKKWLKFYWPKYDKQAHFGLAQMYLADDRFTAYYDEKSGVGATAILCQSIQTFTQRK